MNVKILSLLCGVLWVAGPSRASAQGAASFQIVVCYPEGYVKARDARPAMDSLTKIIERLGGWPRGSFVTHFTNTVEECRKWLGEKKPNLSIMSLGLYLENREKYSLVPVAQPRIHNATTETYRLLVRKGTYNSLDDLKGKVLGGAVLSEPAFLQRVVFKGKIDPASYFKLRPSRALKALRALAKGKLDAVLVNEQQYGALGSLPFAKDIEALFSSDKLPQVGVVANEKLTPPADRQKLLRALTGMCTEPDGKQLCELFGLEAFVPTDAATYKEVISLWNAAKP